MEDCIKVTLEFDVTLEECEEGGYTVTVDDLPGCISEGDTKEEALTNITDAAELYLNSIIAEHKDPLEFENELMGPKK